MILVARHRHHGHDQHSSHPQAALSEDCATCPAPMPSRPIAPGGWGSRDTFLALS